MIGIHMFVMSVCLIFTKEEACGLCCGAEEHRRGDRSNNSANLLVVSLCWLDLVTLVGLDHDEDVIHANSQNLGEKGNFFLSKSYQEGDDLKDNQCGRNPNKAEDPHRSENRKQDDHHSKEAEGDLALYEESTQRKLSILTQG